MDKVFDWLAKAAAWFGQLADGTHEALQWYGKQLRRALLWGVGLLGGAAGLFMLSLAKPEWAAGLGSLAAILATVGVVGMLLVAFPLLGIAHRALQEPAVAAWLAPGQWIFTVLWALPFALGLIRFLPVRERPWLLYWIALFTILLIALDNQRAKRRFQRALLVKSVLAIVFLSLYAALPLTAGAVGGGRWLDPVFHDVVWAVRGTPRELLVGPSADAPLMTADGKRYDLFVGDTAPRVYFHQDSLGNYRFYDRGGISALGDQLRPLTFLERDAPIRWLEVQRSARDSARPDRVPKVDALLGGPQSPPRVDAGRQPPIGRSGAVPAPTKASIERATRVGGDAVNPPEENARRVRQQIDDRVVELKAQVPWTPGQSEWADELASKEVVVHASQAGASEAGLIVYRLQLLRANVRYEFVPDVAEDKAARVYYAFSDLRAAQSIQAAMADKLVLAINSVGRIGTITVWLR